MSYISDWIEERKAGIATNASAAITTIFGDAIKPHGGSIAQTALVKLTGALGISEATTRSAVFRLSTDGYLESERFGRRSDYYLAKSMGQRADQCMYRIYLPRHREWAGDWEVIIIDSNGLETVELAQMGSDFASDGYGRVSLNVFIRPRRDPNPYCRIEELVPEKHSERAAAMIARSAREVPFLKHKNFVASLWRLPELNIDYERFTQDYSELMEQLMSVSNISPVDAFVIRQCMIHEYRHLVMVSPSLPVEYETENKPFDEARYIVRELYDQLVEKSEGFIASVIETAQIAHPPLRMSFYQRFDGLTPSG